MSNCCTRWCTRHWIAGMAATTRLVHLEAIPAIQGAEPLRAALVHLAQAVGAQK
jgi:hypothetical protein